MNRYFMEQTLGHSALLYRVFDMVISAVMGDKLSS